MSIEPVFDVPLANPYNSTGIPLVPDDVNADSSNAIEVNGFQRAPITAIATHYPFYFHGLFLLMPSGRIFFLTQGGGLVKMASVLEVQTHQHPLRLEGKELQAATVSSGRRSLFRPHSRVRPQTRQEYSEKISQNVWVRVSRVSTSSGIVPRLVLRPERVHNELMPKRIKQERRPIDVNQLAHHLVGISTRQNDGTLPPTKAQISMLMAELGRRGGKKGGKRRLQTMTPKERSNVARKAAKARWKDH